MSSRLVSFQNNGITLRGVLDEPAGKPRATALFAHCFTCGRNTLAARRIAQELVARNLAVLRFDFTGLGSSEGDFSDTNFTTNVEDLICAARFMEHEIGAPALLRGHSLGGAAALAACGEIASCRAVVTLGAPRDADHVVNHFACELPDIETEGQAEVTLGLRSFVLKKQLVEDLRERGRYALGDLQRAVLIMHAPGDEVVPVTEAEKIYDALYHPKSFISLDTADHLLSDPADAAYAGQVIAAWSSRYLERV